MTERFLLSRVFDEAPKPGVDRVLATTFFTAPAHGSTAVASLAIHRARIAAAAADRSGSTAPPSSPV